MLLYKLPISRYKSLSFLLIATIVLLIFIGLGCRESESNHNSSDDSGPPQEDDSGIDDANHDEFTEPDQWGPYGVGVRRFDFYDTSRDDRHLPTLIYYPAKATPITEDRYLQAVQEANLIERLRQIAYCAVEDAEPDYHNAPYPIVMFSHGSGARKEEYKFFFEYLSSHGYICVVLDHTGNEGIINYWPRYMDMSLKRPLDISFVLDKVLEMIDTSGDPFESLGDPEKIGLAGHSYGGNTTLALVGATFSYDYIDELCKDDPGDPYICPIPGARDFLEAHLPDKRIKAAITLAHDGADSYFGPDCIGVSSIKIPIMIDSGTSDVMCPYETEALPCFEQLQSPAYLLKMIGGGHIGYTDFVNFGPMRLNRMHSLIQRYAVAFFGYYLKENENYSYYLGDVAAARWNEELDDFSFTSKTSAKNIH